MRARITYTVTMIVETNHAMKSLKQDSEIFFLHCDSCKEPWINDHGDDHPIKEFEHGVKVEEIK